MSAPSVIEVRGVRVSYGAITAIRGVDFNVAEGETVAIVGANGAGKSTLMRAISGVLAPSAGDILFDGKRVNGGPAHALARAGLLHVPEGRGTLRHLTVWENLRLAYDIRPTDIAFPKALSVVVERFPRIGERLQQLAGNLSGGEQQMLSLARALVNRPRVLLVDEPSLGLSPKLVKEAFAVLTEMRDSGVTILVVEQNVRSALKLAHRAYILRNGMIVTEGRASDLLHDPAVISGYLGGH